MAEHRYSATGVSKIPSGFERVAVRRREFHTSSQMCEFSNTELQLLFADVPNGSTRCRAEHSGSGLGNRHVAKLRPEEERESTQPVRRKRTNRAGNLVAETGPADEAFRQ